MDVAAVRALIRNQVKTARSATDFAAKHDMSTSYLYAVLNGDRKPPQRLLETLGLEEVVAVSYEPIVRRAPRKSNGK